MEQDVGRRTGIVAGLARFVARTTPAPAPDRPAPRRNGRVHDAVSAFVGHWPSVAVGIAVLLSGSAWIAAAWFAASRLAYVLFVGVSLQAEDRRSGVEDGGAPRDAAWRRFSARASWLMDNDAVAFVALCLATAGTFPSWISWPAGIAAGGLLAALGIGVKVWAAASLAPGSYHWRNFFVEPEPGEIRAGGPYRWLSNPMYTVGYAHAYGVAVAAHSTTGVAAAAFAQASIVVLHLAVERPHYHRLRGRLAR